MSDKIAKRESGLQLPSAPIQKIEELGKTFAELREHRNLLAPIAAVDHILPMHQVSLRTVLIDPTVNSYGQGPDCYQDKRFCDDDEVALGKNALAKLMSAAGVQIVDRQRLDDRSVAYYWEVQMTLAVRDFDGTMRQVIATKELDLRDGRPDTQKPEKHCKAHKDPDCTKCNKREWKQWTKSGRTTALEASALSDKRRHGQSLCETQAIERGLRLIFGLPQKMKATKVAEPWVVPKLAPALDPSDPEVKTALIHHALHAESSLYGHAQPHSVPRHLSSAPDIEPSPGPQPQQPASGPTETDPDEAGETGDSEEADDLSAFGEVSQSSAPEGICTCPCGDQASLTEAVAKITIEKVGSPRCEKCYPGTRFDYERHKDLPTLGLKKHPNMTPAAARDNANNLRKQSAA